MVRLPHSAALVRVFRLMRFLESVRTGWTYLQLADRFGVSTRTIRRDLEALKAVGAVIPVTHVDDPRSSPAQVHQLTWPHETQPAGVDDAARLAAIGGVS